MFHYRYEKNKKNVKVKYPTVHVKSFYFYLLTISAHSNTIIKYFLISTPPQSDHVYTSVFFIFMSKPHNQKMNFRNAFQVYLGFFFIQGQSLKNKRILNLIIIFFIISVQQTAIRLNENSSKINLLKEEQEEYETKLEKERDIWAAEMFELIVEEDFIANCIVDYIKLQQLYYKTTLQHIELVLEDVGDAISK